MPKSTMINNTILLVFMIAFIIGFVSYALIIDVYRQVMGTMDKFNKLVSSDAMKTEMGVSIILFIISFFISIVAFIVSLYLMYYRKSM